MKTTTRNSNRKVAITGDEDVFSALPEAVLCHILSFLDTEQSVRTSVLSKRWKLVWTSVPSLHCHDGGLVNPTTCFANFVDRFLSLNNVCHVREFFLHCFREYDQSRVDAWIDATIIREIEILDLDLPITSLPNGFFNRNNLVVLRLHRVELDVPKSVYFPSLKIIQLVIVNFLNDASLKNLLSGCLVLEELNIRTFTLDNPCTLYICSSTLKLLRLYTRSAGYYEDYRYKVVIEAPKLNDFHLSDFLGNEYHLGSLSVLHTSYIHFEPEDDQDPSADLKNMILELLRKISQLEYLWLSFGTMHCLEDAQFSNLPMFNNLTHLAVNIDDSFCSWEILPRLLDCSPNLVHFDFEDDCDDHCDCQWPHPLHSVPKCLLSRLETFKTSTPRADRDCDGVMEMIEYFLSNAMVLKKMLIRCTISDLEMKLELCSELLMLPRSSSVCKIELL